MRYFVADPLDDIQETARLRYLLARSTLAIVHASPTLADVQVSLQY